MNDAHERVKDALRRGATVTLSRPPRHYMAGRLHSTYWLSTVNLDSATGETAHVTSDHTLYEVLGECENVAPLPDWTIIEAVQP